MTTLAERRVPIYVCGYTVDYARDAAELIRTLDKHGLKSHVRGMPDLGSWVRNCAQKAVFCRDRMLDYPGHPVVWLDADARVRARPIIFEHAADEGFDFAAHWFGTELLSGTLFFAPTERAWSLVEAWLAATRMAPDVWDQRTLQQIVESTPPDKLAVRRLPPAYTYIFDTFRKAHPNTPIVIEHFQRSRQTRQKEQAS